MQSIGTISENMMQLLPQCLDWVPTMLLLRSDCAFNEGERCSSAGLLSMGELKYVYKITYKGIEILASNASDAKELIYTAWKEAGVICEKLIATGSKEGLCSGIEQCYKGPFEARLISQVCTAPSGFKYSLFSNTPQNTSYLTLLAFSVLCAVSGIVLYNIVDYFRNAQAPIVVVPAPVVVVPGPAAVIAQS